MATSGTVAFRLNIEEIIVEAYERGGSDAQTLTGYQARSARRSLNLMFIEWATRGVNYWATTKASLALTASTTPTALPAGTLDILGPMLRRSGTDIELHRMSLEEYQMQPNKTTEGRPTAYYLDRQYTPNLYLWPVPENSTDTIEYWRFDQIEDITSSNEDADVPYRWTEAMTNGLAFRLYAKKETVDQARLLTMKGMYEESFGYAGDDERDKASLRIVLSSRRTP